MIYVPDLENYKCFVIRNDTTLRADKNIPVNNSDVPYRDYYYTSNYLIKKVESAYSTSTCGHLRTI